MEVFWRYGYAGTSLSILLDEMQIGKKSLYDTFGNKRELFLKALDLYAERSLLELSEKLARPGSAISLLEELLLSEGCGGKGCFYGTNMADFDATDDEMASHFCRHLRNFEKVVEKILRRAQEAGDVSGLACPATLARMLTCLWQGAALMSRVDPEKCRQRAALEAAFCLIRA